MRKLLVLFGATLSVAVAQTPPIVIPGITAFPPQLKQYLTLTDDQVAQIIDLNRKLTEFQTSKLQRQAQLSLEIAQETAKQTLDPMALGIRYMELEAIRRQVTDEQRKTAVQARSLLNDVQKGKIGALQEVLRQYPTACDAIRFNLLTSSFSGNVIPAPGTGIIGPVNGIRIGCPASALIPGISIPGFRTGDFSDVIAEPSQP